MPERRLKLHDLLWAGCQKLPQDYAPLGTVERWADPEQVYPDCSGGCVWAAWLEDAATDWLVCTNPVSHRFGLLTFEHQGCQCFMDKHRE